MRFYLGIAEPYWLRTLGVPAFVSRRRLTRRDRPLPRAAAPWALDSGGFTELSMHGGWSITVRQYAAEIERFAEQIGQLEWAAPMDYMCEPSMLARTGLTVAEHQRRTIQNYLALRELVGGVVAPVLQGWTLHDYQTHVAAYATAGVQLDALPVVGLGSVCRRGQDTEIAAIVRGLQPYRLNLHGFGVRSRTLIRLRLVLASADSMAWSYNARRNPPLPGCTHAHCGNCQRWALRWRERILRGAAQLDLSEEALWIGN